MALLKKSDWRPKASRREGLLVEKTGSELVVYNVEGFRVHCLNEHAARIWGLCDGRKTIAEIADEIDLAMAPKSKALAVGNVIAQLEKLGLVEESPLVPVLVSRRDMARRIGIGVAAAVALPFVTSVTAPTAQAANSCQPSGGPCTKAADCCGTKGCNTGLGKCK